MVANLSEMGQAVDAAVARIAASAEYQLGRLPNGPELVRTIASYERTQCFSIPLLHRW